MRGISGLTVQQQLMTSAAAIVMAASAGPAMAQTRSFDVPAGPASRTIPAFARQAGVQILANGDTVRAKRTNAVKGSYAVDEALRRLLRGTGLAATGPNATGIITIQRDATAQTDSTASLGDAPPAAGEAGKVSSLGEDGSVDAAELDAASADIIVTARKIDERLIDVPLPVSVVNPTALTESSQLRVQDFYSKVPGLGLSLAGDSGAPTIAIRGITTGGVSNPTVAIVVDDAPYGSSLAQGSGFLIPDIDPDDLRQVEVLRGPQGVLYGASNIGGLIKYETIQPDVSEFRGRISAGVTSITYGDVGYDFSGALNVPLSNQIAVRVSGFTHNTPGYIDNVKTGEKDANDRQSDGARASLLWAPSSDFSVNLAGYYQNSRRSSSDEVDTALGNFQQSFVPNGTGYHRKSQVYSATMRGKVGDAELVSITAYNVDRLASNADFSTLLGIFSTLNFGVGGFTAPSLWHTKRFSQELRANVPVATGVALQVGGFYSREKTDSIADFLAVDENTGATAGTLVHLDTPSVFREVAGFGNLTVDFSDRFQVQGGLRVSENRQRLSTTRSGPLVAIFFGGVSSVPAFSSSDTAVTYAITPRFKITPDVMIYARAASGYRPGGPNQTCQPQIPCQYQSDTTRNYEIGLKGKALNGLITFDASAYTIDWSDIQINVIDPTLRVGYVDNAGDAVSKGFEFLLSVKPWTGMTATGWVAYNDAHLTSVSPNSTLGGKAGDRLPYGSPWSGNISLDQAIVLSPSANLSLGASTSFVGSRRGNLTAGTRAVLPGYTQIDLHAGVVVDSWKLNLFVNNLTNKRGVLRAGADSTLGSPTLMSFTQPRTVGLNLSKSF